MFLSGQIIFHFEFETVWGFCFSFFCLSTFLGISHHCKMGDCRIMFVKKKNLYMQQIIRDDLKKRLESLYATKCLSVIGSSAASPCSSFIVTQSVSHSEVHQHSLTWSADTHIADNVSL